MAWFAWAINHEREPGDRKTQSSREDHWGRRAGDCEIEFIDVDGGLSEGFHDDAFSMLSLKEWWLGYP